MWSESHRSKHKQTELEKLLAKGGGLYRSSGKNSVIFNLYSDVHYAQLSARSQGFVIGLAIWCPHGPGRDPEWKKQVDYWNHAGSKRLTSGSLVALVFVSRGSFNAYLANLVSSVEDITESAKHLEECIQVKVKFLDLEVEIEALRKERIMIDANMFAILIDNGVMFELVQPFLKTLSTINSTSIPSVVHRSHSTMSKFVRQNMLPPLDSVSHYRVWPHPARGLTHWMFITPHPLPRPEHNCSDPVSWIQAKWIVSWTLWRGRFH